MSPMVDDSFSAVIRRENCSCNIDSAVLSISLVTSNFNRFDGILSSLNNQKMLELLLERSLANIY